MMWGHEDANLVRLHDGLLDEGISRRVRDHIARCARCRELDEAIRFSRDALSSLSTAELRETDRERVRAAVLSVGPPTSAAMGCAAEVGGPTLWRPLVGFAAAAIVVVAALAWWYRPQVRFVAGPAVPRSIESIAISQQRSFEGDSVVVSEPVSSIDVARRRVQAHAGVSPNLKSAANGEQQLLGITPWLIGSAPASSLVYSIDGRPVVLVVAREARLADPPPSLLRTKRLEMRHDRGARIFTWSASGDSYSLAVPRGVPVSKACAVCHEGTRMMPVIESATRRM